MRGIGILRRRRYGLPGRIALLALVTISNKQITGSWHEATQFDSTIFDRYGSFKAALGVFGPLEAKMGVVDFRLPYPPN